MYTLVERKTEDTITVHIIRTDVYNKFVVDKEVSYTRLIMVSEVVLNKTTGEILKARDPDKLLHALVIEYNANAVRETSTPKKIVFLPEDDIVADYLNYIIQRPEFHSNWIDMVEDDLILLHSSIGRYIRNKYNLWDSSNPYTRYKTEQDPSHPDNMSFSIIQKIWKILHQN